jgi:PadR family transcriptional regulator, regulatory protein PadR
MQQVGHQAKRLRRRRRAKHRSTDVRDQANQEPGPLTLPWIARAQQLALLASHTNATSGAMVVGANPEELALDSGIIYVAVLVSGVVDQERRSQWLRGVLDLCVLAVLRSEREAYGYQLAQALQRSGLGAIQGGTLYPVLLRLERSGLLTSVWREGRAGPARRYYRLTTQGGETLQHAVADWRVFADRVAAVLGTGVSL